MNYRITLVCLVAYLAGMALGAGIVFQFQAGERPSDACIGLVITSGLMLAVANALWSVGEDK